MEFIIAIGIFALVMGAYRFFCPDVNQEESPIEERIRLNELKAEMAGADVKSRAEEYPFVSEESSEEKTHKIPAQVTLELMTSILKDIGCQPKRDGNELLVSYQGENFIVRTGGYYAQIWDPSWGRINLKDPNLEKMKEAGNISNFEFGPTILWTSPDEEGWINLHSKREFVVFPHIPNRNDYIRAILDSFFEKKNMMRGQLSSLINQQQEAPKQHRPVGFATDAQ